MHSLSLLIHWTLYFMIFLQYFIYLCIFCNTNIMTDLLKEHFFSLVCIVYCFFCIFCFEGIKQNIGIGWWRAKLSIARFHYLTYTGYLHLHTFNFSVVHPTLKLKVCKWRYTSTLMLTAGLMLNKHIDACIQYLVMWVNVVE